MKNQGVPEAKGKKERKKLKKSTESKGEELEEKDKVKNDVDKEKEREIDRAKIDQYTFQHIFFAKDGQCFTQELIIKFQN